MVARRIGMIMTRAVNTRIKLVKKTGVVESRSLLLGGCRCVVAASTGCSTAEAWLMATVVNLSPSRVSHWVDHIGAGTRVVGAGVVAVHATV